MRRTCECTHAHSFFTAQDPASHKALAGATLANRPEIQASTCTACRYQLDLPREKTSSWGTSHPFHATHPTPSPFPRPLRFVVLRHSLPNIGGTRFHVSYLPTREKWRRTWPRGARCDAPPQRAGEACAYVRPRDSETVRIRLKNRVADRCRRSSRNSLTKS